MKKGALISLQGRQNYLDQDPDFIELVTEGSFDIHENGWEICYDESSLTGMEGVTTTLRCEDSRIILTRTGKLHSQMIFQEGVSHDSLYQSEFGALMVTVRATKISVDVNENGGVVDLVYDIEVERSSVGVVEYHLEIQPQK